MSIRRSALVALSAAAVVGSVLAAPGTAVAVATVPAQAIAYISATESSSKLLVAGLTADGRSRTSEDPVELYSAGVGQALFGASVSPDGTKVVFEVGRPDEIFPSDLYVVPLDGSAGVRRLTTTENAFYPSWSPDSARVLFTTFNDDFSTSLMTVPAGGGKASPVAGGADKAEGVYVPGSDKIVAVDYVDGGLVSLSSGKATPIKGSDGLYAPSISPDGKRIAAVKDDLDSPDHGAWIAVLPIGGGTVKRQTAFFSSPSEDGSSRFALDLDPEWNDSGTVIHFDREVETYDESNEFIGAGGTLGTTLASDPAGSEQTGNVQDGYFELSASVKTKDTLDPVAQMTTPVSLGTSVPSFTLRWKAWDPGFSGVAKYDVKFSRYTTSGSKAEATLATGTTATSRVMNLKGGYYYCFYSRATDKAGNVGAWSAPRCIATALDDKSLGKSKGGWTTNTSSKYYGGSASWTGKKGAYVVRTGVTAKQVGIVVRTCTTCGAVNLYIGSTKIGTLNTKSSSPSFQKTIWLPATKSTLKGNLKIQTTSTARVFIDGIYVRTF